jgi:hypothetical protein
MELAIIGKLQKQEKGIFMNAIDKWLLKQADRENKIPSLIDALLSNRVSPYVIYRLKFLSTRIFVELLITIIEFTFFFSLLKREHVQVLLMAKIATVLFSAFLWGALELPRTRLRSLMDSGRRILVQIEIRNWLFLASIISAILLSISLIYLIISSTQGDGLNYVEFYMFASLLKISLDVFVRTFHSCIYAMSRIFRPLFIIVLFQLTLFSCSLVLWYFIGPWALPMTQFLVSFLLSGIMIYYTNLQYKRLKLPSEKITSKIKLPRINIKEFIFFLTTGFSNLFLQLEAVLVLVFLRSGQFNVQLINYALFFFLISPLLKGAFDWARLFYFDYKRLEIGIFSNFRAQLNRFLNVVSVISAIVFWFFAVIVSLIFFKSLSLNLALVLLFAFITRSILGSYQIRAFSNSRYLELLLSEIIFIISISFVFFLKTNSSITDLIINISLIEILSLIPIIIISFMPFRIWQEKYIYPYTEWLNIVKKFKSPCRIGIIKFNINEENNLIQQKAFLIKKRLGKSGIVSFLDHKSIIFLERKNLKIITKGALFILFSGTIKKIHLSEMHLNGYKALLSLQSKISQKEYSEEDLVHEFKRLFPDGDIIHIGKNNDTSVTRHMRTSDRRAIFSEAIRFSKKLLKGSNKLRYDVSSYSPKGELKLVFLSKKRVDIKKWIKWLDILDNINYKNSLN